MLWKALQIAIVTLVLLASGAAASKEKKQQVTPEPTPPEMQLLGGRKLTYERSFHSAREVQPKRPFWKKVLDFVAGEPEFHSLVRPYSIATDSRGRIIVTDPGAYGVHIFDFQQQKYKFLSRVDKGKDPMLTPQCVAVDAQDNIYVTDSESGKVFVFNSDGKFQRAIGSLKGGEGFFKRPTGIAVDSAAQRIYVTDTLRNKIFVTDMQGSVLQTIGSNGEGKGEFNYPTELRLHGDNLVVVDAMNFRVQVLDRSPDSSSTRLGSLAISRARCSVPRAWGLTRKAISTWWMGCGAWCRCSTAKANCCTPSASAAPGWENSSCRRGCSSIATTASSWSIRSTGACRSSITTAWRSRPREARSEARDAMLLAFLLAGIPLLAQITGDVIGTHDLSPGSKSPITGARPGSCSYCHAPHSGLATGMSLWNQTQTKATYQLYNSTTYHQKGQQPVLGSDSNLCLSCHDGTVAVGNTIVSGQITMSGSMNAQDVLGTNLQSSHPFSLQLPIKDTIDLIASLASRRARPAIRSRR